ncbi:response regulator transcription factor [Archangium lansingense]|uniref:LuxR C-terminal-related transcriptional regulator n=1 Tax=Archangium lansingense TaxID=2995310 RepID=A0ABT4A173_9BACT|nr:LuxR family transcriptional regulator [Archangium lansinium]MCY1074754.1 LuxR C-terminal-related transcriptional regulator [Archangium lansinium]
MDLDSRERALTLELKEALASSLELSVVLSRMKGALFQLFPAEHAAWCMSKQGLPAGYEWVATDRLAAFLARYREMAGGDFVRGTVSHLPNVVFRDSEMVPRAVLERSRPYQLCRELRTPLEHVMSVRLDMRQGWHGGLTVYREQRLSFSERERALLQGLTPALARTVRNCRMLGAVVKGHPFPEVLLHQRDLECLVLTPAFAEVLRTARVTAWLEAWFSPSELGPSGLPIEWVERLAWLGSLQEDGEPGLDRWECVRGDRRLRVTFIRMPEQEGRRLWTLVLEEEPSYFIPVPSVWRPLLTWRETEVLGLLLQGYFIESIAVLLGITWHTANTHWKNIRNELKVADRAELLYQAAVLSREERE